MPGYVSRKSIPARSASEYADFTAMLSGVIHEAVLAPASGSGASANGTVVKSGMRLIDQGLGRATLCIMVRMLVADNPLQRLGIGELAGGPAWQAADGGSPAQL